MGEAGRPETLQALRCPVLDLSRQSQYPRIGYFAVGETVSEMERGR